MKTREGDVVTQKLASLHNDGGKTTPMTEIQLTTDKKIKKKTFRGTALENKSRAAERRSLCCS